MCGVQEDLDRELADELEPWMDATLDFCGSQELLHASSTLQSASLLALCKLMTVSSAFCAKGLRLIFSILAKQCALGTFPPACIKRG